MLVPDADEGVTSFDPTRLDPTTSMNDPRRLQDIHTCRRLLQDRLPLICPDLELKVGDLDFDRDAWCLYRSGPDGELSREAEVRIPADWLRAGAWGRVEERIRREVCPGQ